MARSRRVGGKNWRNACRAILLVLFFPQALHAADVVKRTEGELVSTWGTGFEESNHSCEQKNAMFQCIGNAYQQNSTASYTGIRARNWLSERWGGELQLGADVLQIVRKTAAAPGGPSYEYYNSTSPNWRALVLGDWRWLGAGVGVHAGQGAESFYAIPALYLRLGPEAIHFEAHLNDGGWSGASDGETMGLAAGYDLPRDFALTKWMLAHDSDFRIEVWFGSRNYSFSATELGQPQLGLRIVGPRASLRVTWTRGTVINFHDSTSISAGQVATVGRYSMSDLWSIGLAIPLGAAPIMAMPAQ